MSAKPIMIQGTSSGVGKTIITMALCRIFKQDGYKTAPFKSQNMTPNTAFTENGDEIAVSQLLQAYAAGAEPVADMNPILLKPPNFRASRKIDLFEVMAAYSRLAAMYDVIVIEGAGSPVELNLNKNDIVNMGIAVRAGAPVLLVADIDRGGVFASLFGTVELLEKTEKEYIKALVVNRFRGDIPSFDSGVAIIENITALPVAGVVPYIDLKIPEEDSLYNPDASQYQPGENLESQFDLIADTVRKSLDMEMIYKILNDGMHHE